MIAVHLDIMMMKEIGLNEPWKDIKRIYIVPEEELHNDIQIDIYDDWPKIRRAKFEWIEKYRVDENRFNDIYHNMDLANCLVLRPYKIDNIK